MTQALHGFITTWSPAFSSTNQRIALRNIRQGGNDLLAAVPLTAQSMWAGDLMAAVASAVSGPFYAIAKCFQIIFSPFISLPFSVFSCAAREGFYEQSVRARVQPTTRFYRLGDEVDTEVNGTMTLSVEGVDRHFLLGDQIDAYVAQTILHQGKRYWFERLGQNEAFDSRCREVVLDGQRVRVRLGEEAPEKKWVESEWNGVKHYFEVIKEVEAPIRGSVRCIAPQGFRYIFRQLVEIAEEQPDCIKNTCPEQTFYYDTGEELAAFEPGARTFVIDGQERYFRTAKYVRQESVGLAGFINKATQKFIGHEILPTRLSRFQANVLRLVNQYSSDLIRVAIAVAGVVLFFFGHTAMAAGVLVAVSYETLDHDLGLIPHKVSLFMEKWMPIVSMAGLLIVGSTTSQIMAAGALLMMIPAVQTMVHHKISKMARAIMCEIIVPFINWFSGRMDGGMLRDETGELVELIRNFHHLEDCEAPLIQRKDMSAQEVHAILDGNDEDYQLNPASLTKSIEPILQLEENHNFQLLMGLWDGVGAAWIQQYPRLLKRVADDKRFILMLKQTYPEAKRFFFEFDPNNYDLDYQQQYQLAWENYLRDIENWIAPLAREQNISKEQFVAAYLRRELQCFIDKINGNQPIEGEQRYLRDAIDNTSKILPFLLRPEVSRVDLEDAVLKLAIEGGNYCSLAMWRASNEVLEGFTRECIDRLEQQMDPNQRLENEIMREFQHGRFRSIQGAFDIVMGLLREREQLRDTADDVHLYTAITRAVKRGYYPLSEEEKSDFGIDELLFSETFMLPFRAMLVEEFKRRIPEAMNALGIDRQNNNRPDRIVNFLRNWVQQNPHIAQDQQQALLEGSLNNDDDHLADPDNYPKWNRLILVILGIYKNRSVNAV